MSFLEAVGKLIAAGVEFYQVDYVGLRKTCYGADGQTVTTPIPFNNSRQENFNNHASKNQPTQMKGNIL